MRKTVLVTMALGLWLYGQSPIAVQVTAVPQRDVFTTDVQPFILSTDPFPGAPVMLFWSGELLLQDTDYVISGRTVTVTAPLGDNPIVQIWYWKVKP